MNLRNNNPLPPVQNRPLSVRERNDLTWDDKFDRDFDRMERTVRRGAGLAMVLGVVWFAVVLGVIGFIGWAIYQTMQHFGII